MKIIAVYSKNHIKPINKNAGLLTVDTDVHIPLGFEALSETIR
jgi:hypothetical protein